MSSCRDALWSMVRLARRGVVGAERVLDSTSQVCGKEVDARTSWVYQRGYLDLMLPYDVDPDGEYILFNKNFPHSLSVTLKVEEGASYLIDFEVSSWGSGTYTVKTDSGSQESDDQNAKTEHILVGLNASASEWTTVRLTRSGTGWYMYGATVDRVN